MNRRRERHKNLSDLWIAVDNSPPTGTGLLERLCCETTLVGEFAGRVVTAVLRNDPSSGRNLRRLLLALHLDGFDRSLCGLRVEVAATDLDRLHVVIQLVQQWDTGGNVESHHRLVAHAVQMLDDCAQ
jgi:hypothetical protein